MEKRAGNVMTVNAAKKEKRNSKKYLIRELNLSSVPKIRKMASVVPFGQEKKILFFPLG